MPSSTRRPAPRAGISRASTRGVQSPETVSRHVGWAEHREPHHDACRRWVSPSAQPILRDETVDLAVAEQPLPVLFDELIVVGAARADFWSLRAVLHDRPVRAHL